MNETTNWSRRRRRSECIYLYIHKNAMLYHYGVRVCVSVCVYGCEMCARMTRTESWSDNFSFVLPLSHLTTKWIIIINEKRKTHFEMIFLDALCTTYTLSRNGWFLSPSSSSSSSRFVIYWKQQNSIIAQLNLYFQFFVRRFSKSWKCVSWDGRSSEWAKNKLDAVGIKWNYNFYYSNSWRGKVKQEKKIKNSTLRR